MTRAGAVKSDEGVLPDDGMLVFAGAFLHDRLFFTNSGIVFHVGLITSPGSVFRVSAVILIQIGIIYLILYNCNVTH